MVIRIFYFAVAIFSVAMVFLSLQSPYLSELFDHNVSVANMQMNGVVDYEVEEKIIGKYRADSVIRYKNSDNFVNFSGFFVDDLNHTLSSKEVIKKGDILLFKKEAKYHNSDDLNYVSDEIIYNAKSKILESKVPFVMTQKSDKITGQSVRYDMNKKQTNVKGVRGWVWREE